VFDFNTIKYLRKFFEGKKTNPVTIEGDLPLSKDLKLIKVGEETSPIEISKTGANISGSLQNDGKDVVVNRKQILGTLHINAANDLIITTDHNTGQVTIDKNSTNTTSSTTTAMQIDFDHTGVAASGQTLNNIGLDLDINSDSPTMVGTVNDIGIDIDVVGAQTGVSHISKGIDVTVSGSNIGTGIDINMSGNALSSGLRIDSTDVTNHIVLAHNTNDYATFKVADTGDLTIATVGDGSLDSDLLLDADGGIRLDAASSLISIDNAGTTFGTINTATGNKLKIIGTTNYNVELYSLGTGNVSLNSADDIKIDAADTLTLDCDGTFIMKQNGTEFSIANSAYAGMIIGYTCVGADVADDSYTLTTSISGFQDSGGGFIKVSFRTPPSEYVEIEAELFFSAGSGASDLILSLSDAALYATNSLIHAAQFEKRVCEPARGNGGTVTQKWLLQPEHLEATGINNDIYIAAACDSTTGTPIIRWGGNVTDEYTNLVLKATALPATIVEGS
jgi:hypothetical protein